MKKRIFILFLLCLVCLLVTGCSKDMDSQAAVPESSQPDSSPDNIAAKTQDKQEVIDTVDVDLTKLSSTMIYAEVYNIMLNPDDYTGKTMRMSGAYNALYYDETDKYYHYVIIEDAAACCQQGLEFIWQGQHTYPDDYPADQASIEVTGVFESYEELDQPYYRLSVEDVVIL